MSEYVRILVDGYNLLHVWTDLAPDHPRYSQEARAELTYFLQQYQDESGTPVSVIFDGNPAFNQSSPGKKKKKKPGKTSTGDGESDVEVVYSPAGMSADNVIERVAYRLKEYGKVLVVTNDSLEKSVVHSFGAHSISCHAFIDEIMASNQTFSQKIKSHNHKAKSHFRR